MFNPFILLTDHIRMALENDSRYIFISWGSLLYNKYVACLVGLFSKIAFSCKFLKISYDLLFMTRFPWNLSDFLEEG